MNVEFTTFCVLSAKIILHLYILGLRGVFKCAKAANRIKLPPCCYGEVRRKSPRGVLRRNGLNYVL